MKKVLLSSVAYLLLLVVFFTVADDAKAQVAFDSAKITLSTSRPSASAPIETTDVAASAGQILVDDNGSFYLSGDVGIILPDTGETLDNAITVSSMTDSDGTSGNNTTLTLSLSSSPSNSHHIGNAFFVPITALHTIEFEAQATIPASGNILLTYPVLAAGDANTTASPSATTFQMNGLGDTQIQVYNVTDSTDISANITAVVTNPAGGTSPTIELTLDGATDIDANDVVRIFLGCSTVSGSGASAACGTEVPRIINPTKSASAGSEDSWNVTITSRNSLDVEINETTVAINTIESVQVQATVDPTLSITISGIADSTPINDGNATGCTWDENTSSGIASTSTLVNLGSLSSTPGINSLVADRAGQRINITTNADNGYVLVATASGTLRNEASATNITTATTPQSFPVSADFFGLHPCGLDVDESNWTESGTEDCETMPLGSASEECEYAWPHDGSSSTTLSIASDSDGPVGNNVSAGNGITSIMYAAGIDELVPAGEYRAIVTYIATPTF